MSNNPLADAAQACDIAKVQELLDEGADADILNESGDAAIHWAAANNRTDIVCLLLEYGANVSLKTGGGYDALSIARMHNCQDVIKHLEEALKKGTFSTSQPRKFPATIERWVRMDNNQIAHIATSPSIRQKITTIFNFKTRRAIIIADDLSSKARGMTPPESFDATPPAILEEALENFKQQGGEADREFVLHRVTRLDK